MYKDICLNFRLLLFIAIFCLLGSSYAFSGTVSSFKANYDVVPMLEAKNNLLAVTFSKKNRNNKKGTLKRKSKSISRGKRKSRLKNRAKNLPSKTYVEEVVVIDSTPNSNDDKGLYILEKKGFIFSLSHSALSVKVSGVDVDTDGEMNLNSNPSSSSSSGVGISYNFSGKGNIYSLGLEVANNSIEYNLTEGAVSLVGVSNQYPTYTIIWNMYEKDSLFGWGFSINNGKAFNVNKTSRTEAEIVSYYYNEADVFALFRIDYKIFGYFLVDFKVGANLYRESDYFTKDKISYFWASSLGVDFDSFYSINFSFNSRDMTYIHNKSTLKMEKNYLKASIYYHY